METDIENRAFRNLDTYRGSLNARTECCGRAVRLIVSSVFSVSAPHHSKDYMDGYDDFGNYIKIN